MDQEGSVRREHQLAMDHELWGGHYCTGHTYRRHTCVQTLGPIQYVLFWLLQILEPDTYRRHLMYNAGFRAGVQDAVCTL